MLSHAIILLGANETKVNMDRRALREAGFTQVTLRTNGIETAKMLAKKLCASKNPLPVILICQQQLEDMSGEQFCAIVRQHPALSKIPILLILPSNSESERLEVMDCGASAFLCRPYSVDQLKKILDKLTTLAPDSLRNIVENREADTNQFEEALATYGIFLHTEKQPADYFKIGMRCLNKSNWGLAIAAFEKSLPDITIKAESELGIATAWRGKGDLTQFRAWLANATETFVKAKRWQRARTAYARLLQIDPSARNPFLSEAHRQMREGLYEDAAETLVQGHSLISKMKAGERYARFCMSAGDSDAMLEALEEALEREGEKEFLGEDIRKSLSSMRRQREERLREQAEDRKWQLAKNMGWKPEKKEETPVTETIQPSRAVQRQEKFKIAIETLEKEPVVEPDTIYPWQDEDLKQDEEITEDSSQGLFTSGSLFGDFLSMIRLTWRLDKSVKKNQGAS